MGITSRKTRTLFSSATLAFAQQHPAKSERTPRPRRNRARRSFSPPQPSQDRTKPQTTDRRQSAGNWETKPGRIKLPCPPIVGDPAETTWVAFRETYVALMEAAFSKYTVSDWRRAESAFDEEFAPAYVRDVTPEMLHRFEDFVCEAGYSKYRIENMVSRLHHAVLWACEAGYLNREAFGIGPDFVWPAKSKGTWTRKINRYRGEAA